MPSTKKHFRIINQVTGNPEHTLAIVGMAADGPAHVPFMLNIEDPVAVLGSCPLADAYIAAKEAGAQNIILYRLNGEHGEMIVRCITPTISTDVIKLTTVSADAVYNDTKAMIYSTHLFFPATEYRDARSYFFNRYESIHDLVYAINLDADFGLIEFTAELMDRFFDIEAFGDIAAPIILEASGAHSGLELMLDHANNNVMKEATLPILDSLKTALFGPFEDDYMDRGANSILSVLDFGVLVLADLYHDENEEYAKVLGEFCEMKSKDNNQNCIGVISAGLLIDSTPEMITTFRDKLVNLSKTQPQSEFRNYVQIIVGDTRDYKNATVIPVSYMYAGTQVALPYQTMMTNKQILGIRELLYKLSKEDVETLSANGYTCIVASIRKGHVPYSAVTYTVNPKSSFRKPHCTRISHYIVNYISSKLDYMIGTNVDPILKREIQNQINIYMKEFVDKGVIHSYSAECKFLGDNTELQVDISIKVFSEIQRVNSVVTMNVPGGLIV